MLSGLSSHHSCAHTSGGIKGSYQIDIKSSTMTLSYVTSAGFFLLGICILPLSTLQGNKCATLKCDLGVIFFFLTKIHATVRKVASSHAEGEKVPRRRL